MIGISKITSLIRPPFLESNAKMDPSSKYYIGNSNAQTTQRPTKDIVHKTTMCRYYKVRKNYESKCVKCTITKQSGWDFVIE